MEPNIPSGLKWMKQLAAIGPYLRADLSAEKCYFFDCLSVCLSAKKAPESREFYGWWFELTERDDGFVYNYRFGLYDSQCQWQAREIPAKHRPEVERSLQQFFEKLLTVIQQEQGLTIAPAEDLDEKLHLSAA